MSREQDSVAVLRRLREQSARDAQHTGLTEPERAESSNEVAALDFAIAAIQSQQGATGGAVLRQFVEGLDCECDPDYSTQTCGRCQALAHPQAAGSAPGEALHPAHTVEAARRAFNIDPAGSVASGAGDLSMSMFASRADYEAAAGSAPVGVESDKRQGLPAQPYFWLASVLTTYGDKLSPSAMALITERLAATPAIDAALEQERAE